MFYYMLHHIYVTFCVVSSVILPHKVWLKTNYFLYKLPEVRECIQCQLKNNGLTLSTLHTKDLYKKEWFQWNYSLGAASLFFFFPHLHSDNYPLVWNWYNTQKASCSSDRMFFMFFILLLWQILEELLFYRKKSYMHILFVRCINGDGESTHCIQHDDFLFFFFFLL